MTHLKCTSTSRAFWQVMHFKQLKAACNSTERADVRELFELAPDKSLDGSLGSPSRETVNSLAMVHRSLKEATSDLSEISQNVELNLVTKAFPTLLVNEHVFAKARELGLNEAVGCLHFATNFSTIVDEVMKRITKLPFIFYTHPKSYYEIPLDFVKFEDMPTIPKPLHVLPSRDIAKLHDYRKKWLEAVRAATVRSETTKHKFSTLPIALYETELPKNVDLDFSFFLIGEHIPVAPRKILFYKGTVFHKCSKENEVLMVALGRYC